MSVPGPGQEHSADQYQIPQRNLTQRTIVNRSILDFLGSTAYQIGAQSVSATDVSLTRTGIWYESNGDLEAAYRTSSADL